VLAENWKRRQDFFVFHLLQTLLVSSTLVSKLVLFGIAILKFQQRIVPQHPQVPIMTASSIFIKSSNVKLVKLAAKVQSELLVLANASTLQRLLQLVRRVRAVEHLPSRSQLRNVAMVTKN